LESTRPAFIWPKALSKVAWHLPSRASTLLLRIPD
jgi:hypothetical protein